MIEIITHCYSANPVPIYHRLLALQLNSMLSCGSSYNSMKEGEQPKVVVTVCFTAEDYMTGSVITRAASVKCSWVKINPMPLSKENLFRRAIGRNKAALETEADVVWFTDCDHLANIAALQAILKFGKEIPEDGPQMIHPRIVQINRTHALGDDFLNSSFSLKELKIPPKDFQPRRERKAIGGLQIVSGDWARKMGYLDGTDWVKPLPDAEHFLSCKCDVPYRREICGGSRAKDIPGIFRVRHSRAGRDQGTKDHGSPG